MDKHEVCKMVARRIKGCTKADVMCVLETYAEVMKIILQKYPDETFMLPNIGKFSIVKIPERKGKASFNGKEFFVPAHNELKFAFMDKVKDLEK